MILLEKIYHYRCIPSVKFKQFAGSLPAWELPSDESPVENAGTSSAADTTIATSDMRTLSVADDQLQREMKPGELATVVKSYRESMRFLGQPVDDITDEQLAAYTLQVQKGLASAGISVEVFVRGHIELMDALNAEQQKKASGTHEKG